MRDAAPSDAILERLLTLHPKIIDLTLDRVWRLLGALGNPERALPPVIHIAGTNGKGSTLAMIRAGLEASGDAVHAYTSPHLVRFHERIRLAGHLIEEAVLSALLEECEIANGDIPITYFEITTVAALLAFARTPASYTLLEVGLGGRLDATNVIERPALTVITPVSIDHQQYLGETLGEIAGEKAGILKPGVACVVGPQADEAREVIEARAAEVGAPLLIHAQDWMVRTEHGRLVFEDDRGLLDLDMPRLPGQHQIQNAGTAIAALRALGQDETTCQQGLSRAVWPARLQNLKSGGLAERAGPLIDLWLDGGHNAAAGEALAAMMDDWHARDPRPVHLIMGMLETKSAADYLRPLAPRTTQTHCLTIPDTPASFPGETLVELAISVDARAKAAESLDEALSEIAQTTAHPARVVICGSLYLAGHALSLDEQPI
ncbi:MAG: folylpolyglutamate synthase/dihydrofolate synthase family protein [Pseudomonadota bacterium]